MEMKMRTMMIASIVVGLMMAGTAMAATTSVIQTGSTYMAVGVTSLKATLVNQDPTSADPDSYVTLLFKLENWGTSAASGVTFKLAESYPFSLDPGTNATTDLGTIGSMETGSRAYFVKYKLKVDADAVSGENRIKVEYGNATAMASQEFNVTVTNARTDFEIVSQDSTSAAANLAIANVGANTAYSTIVRVPDQEGFTVSGSSASIIGNLDAGDYTLVSFAVSQSVAGNFTAQAGPGAGFTPGSTAVAAAPSGASTAAASAAPAQAKALKVEVSYTDELGIRRTVEKEVDLDLSSAAVSTATRSAAASSSSGLTQALGNNGLTYIAIGLGGIAAVLVVFKLMGRKKHEAK